MTTTITESELLEETARLSIKKAHELEKRVKEAEQMLRAVSEHVVHVSDRIAQQIAAEYGEKPDGEMLEHLLDCLVIAWRARWQLGVMESDIQLVPAKGDNDGH